MDAQREGKDSSKPIRILLVEDHADTLNVFTRVLVDLGHQVTGVSTIHDARAAAATAPFDVALCDVELPDGSGWDLMPDLAGRGIRGIALTGFGMDEDLKRSEKAGFTEHLTKPVDVTRLEAAIQRVAATRARHRRT